MSNILYGWKYAFCFSKGPGPDLWNLNGIHSHLWQIERKLCGKKHHRTEFWILNSTLHWDMADIVGGGKQTLHITLKLWYLFKQKIWRNGIYKVFSICTLSIWEEICWPYKAPFWCHIFCIFEHLFWQLRGVLCQNFQHFLKIYECQIVYIPLFWPVLHRGPVQLPVHFTLPQKIVGLQNIIYSSFSPVFVFLSHIIDRYDVQGYPVCLEGHKLPLKPKIKCSWHTSAIYGWKK